MRYLVTGATGFVGGRLTAQLIERGHHVVAVVRDPGKAGALRRLGVELQRGDITDRESLRAPMAGVDGVFHVAGWYKLGVKDASDGARINVEGTRNVLETMRELGIPKGVYTSSLAVNSDTRGREVDESYRYDGPHLSEYDRTKWLAHYEVAEPLIAAGLPLVIVQPGLIYGPGDPSATGRTFRAYLRRRLPVIPARTAYCWAHVDDIAGAHIRAIEAGRAGERYIIAGPPHTLADAFALAARITGVPAPRVKAPPVMLAAASRVSGLLERVTTLPEDYASEFLRITAGVTYLGSNRKARRELGYAPRPLAEGLRETLRHEMRAHGMEPPA